MRVIAFMNQKGGVGKTTCVANVGDTLARLKYKVLLVDLDPQSNLTLSLGIPYEEGVTKNINQILLGETTAGESIIERNKGLFIIPSHDSLVDIDLKLAPKYEREKFLKHALDPIINNYDYVLIDCPPSLGLLVVNALCCASEVIIPVQTQFLSLRGTDLLNKTLSVINKSLNPDITVTGIIATMFDSRVVAHKNILNNLRADFGNLVFKTTIRHTIAFQDATILNKTIFEFDKRSYGADDIYHLTNEIINSGDKKGV